MINAAVFGLLPPMRTHLTNRPADARHPTLRELLGRRQVQLSYLMTAVVMMGGFIVIPNLSAYVQENLHFSRAHLGSLYLGGGVVSFFATRLGGRLVDRLGSFRVGTAGALIVLAVQLVSSSWRRRGSR